MSHHCKAVHVSTVRTPREVRVFHHECLSLRDAGYEIELVVHNGDQDETDEGILVRTLGPMRKTRRGLLLTARLGAVLRAAKQIRASKADIVHLHDPELIPLGLWLKLTSRAKVIYDSAENYTAYMSQKYFLPAPVRCGLTYLMDFLETTAARRLDAVVTADEGTSEIFRGRRARRVVTLHNFPVIELFDTPPVADQDKRYDLVYHGSIPKYHLEAAFEVASELKRRGRDVRWLFFGACNDVPWAEQQIRERGLAGSFEIRGRVGHDEVAPLVAEARIGFIPLPDMPKFHQNIPMKLFEFMTLRMPAVLSDLPPSRPFAGDGKAATMVPPEDYPAYADAIEQLLDDPQLRQQMGEEGRRRVEQEYNWTAESKKLISLYQDLVVNP